MSPPLAIDLYCGLGGWTEGLLAERYDVVGFDIERHVYGEHRYPAQLVIQDVRTIHGRQFKDAALIVASPPCQEFSYMAMPWKRAKQIAKALRGQGEFPAGYKGSRTVQELTALFNACFRIQGEASEAAGHHIPMVVENVKGAQPWVGKARWNFGSYYLWGDVPALMPGTFCGVKVAGMNWSGSDKPGYRAVAFNDPRHLDAGQRNDGGSWFNIGSPGQKVVNRNPVHDGAKGPFADGRCIRCGHPEAEHDEPFQQCRAWVDGEGWCLCFPHGASYGSPIKTVGHVNQRDGYSHTRHLTNQAESDAVKVPGFSGPAWFDETGKHASKSTARKAASARIAKIPFHLASYIAHVYRPSLSFSVREP